jgi:Tol biopolymer transport system component
MRSRGHARTAATRSLGALAAATALLLLLTASPATGQASLRPLRPPVDQLLSYGWETVGTDRWGNPQAETRLFRMRADGTEQARLGTGMLPLWAPDGVSFAYSVPRENGPAALFVRDATGRTTEIGRGSRQLDWSPDATRVAFIDGERGLVVHEVASGRQRVVFRMGSYEWMRVDWAPAGETIAISSGDDWPEPTSELLVDSDGSNVRRMRIIGDDNSDDGSYPYSETFSAWTPDGSAFLLHNREGLHLVDPADLDQRRLVAPGGNISPCCYAAWFGRRDIWSPDGQQFLYSTNGQDLWIGHLDGRSGRRLDTNARGAAWLAEAGAWSPDGRQVAYRASDRIRVADATAGTAPREVATADDGVFVGEVRWTADGRRVLVLRTSPRENDPSSNQTRTELVRVAVDGSGTQAVPVPFRMSGDNMEWREMFDLAPRFFLGTERVAGADRVGTSAAAAQRGFERADAVVIARADAYPDALAGSALAGKTGAPLLLTAPRELPAAVTAQVRRLRPTTAYVLGGRPVISDRVIDALRAAGVSQVVRIGGTNRYDTARLIADRVGGDRAFLVRGADPDPRRGWADAVAVSALAAHTRTPILLAAPTGLPPETRAALQGKRHVTIIGGPTVISEQVEADLQAAGHTVERLAGADRYATSAAVADAAQTAGMHPDRLIAVTGANWPDALSAGALTAHIGGTLLLTPPTAIPQDSATATWLTERPLPDVVLIGGGTALHPQVIRDMRALAGS